MSALTDAIQVAGPDNVAAAIRNDPAWAVFNLLWEQPGQIAPACEAMGWTTLEEVLAWVNATSAAIGDARSFSMLVDPEAPHTYAAMKTVPWARLHEAIHATGLLAPDCQLHNSDGMYRLPTKQQWQDIASACPSKRWKHSGNDTFDCDDAVRMALGWLSAKGLGNCAAAFTATRHYLGTSVTGGHAVVLVWDDTLTPYQWEPQNGQLYAVTHPKLGGNFLATRIEYARIFA